MASIAIGDIHGNVAALGDLLAQLEPALTSQDTVVFLGDYIDRGAQSAQVVDRILTLRRESPATVVTLKGNHEDWLLKTMRDHTYHSWLLATEAYSTIESYSPVAAEAIRAAEKQIDRNALYGGLAPLPYDLFFDTLPPTHVGFFRELRLFYQTADGIFVHAGVEAQIAGIADGTPHARDDVVTVRVGGAEFAHAAADLGEEVAGLQFKIVVVDLGHFYFASN